MWIVFAKFVTRHFYPCMVARIMHLLPTEDLRLHFKIDTVHRCAKPTVR